jgi:phospholipid/cholesterol/gamma-HCH transport system ATP-binding protein
MTGLAIGQGLARAEPAAAEPRRAGTLRFEELGKVYTSAAGAVPALSGIDLDIRAGEIFGIIGRSGAGKSSLLRTINRLEEPTHGRVLVDGEDIAGLNEAGLVALRRRIGMIFQHFNLLSAKTVQENVALPLRAHARLPEPVLQRLVRMKLHAVGLLAAADAWPRELSGGMARRVALARAIALDPPLMLYDEPLTGLDPIASGVIMSLIKRLNDTLGLTSIIVSHHVHETLPICDQAVVIANGGIVFAGTPAQLQDSTDPLVRQFLLGEPDGPIPFDAPVRNYGQEAA